MNESRPPLRGLLEASLYHDAEQTEAIERFYADVLGLVKVADWPGGHAFRLGDSVLLLFERKALESREGPVSAHGSSGPGHVCLVTDRGAFEAWKDELSRRGVAITHEHEWPGACRSFYFTDPAGNLLEVADGDLWPPA